MRVRRGDRLTQFRRKLAAAGVSRPWLARSVGRTRTVIDRWCDGSADPDPSVDAWLDRRIADPPPRLPRANSGVTPFAPGS